MSNILKGLNEGYFSRDEQDQQNAMDTRRSSDLSRERNAGLNEPDEYSSEPIQTRNGVYEYTVPAGQESIAKELGLQHHRGHWVSRIPIQRANFQFGRPQFHEIPSKNVSEAEQDYGPEYQDKVKRLGQMAKQGERKTVWDPVKRVYKTVPVNPPKEQGVAEDEAPLEHHTARVSYHKEGDPHRRYEAIFKTTHNGGKEETEKRAKAAFAAKKKIVYDIVHEQGVAEAGNKPLEKSRFGTGDTRTPRDIKSQMSGASDEFVKSTADKTTGPFHSKVAKMQGKMAKSELRKREQGVAEGSSTNAEVTKRAKAAAQKAGKTFNTDVEYRLWYAITTQANAATRKADKKQGVAEGSKTPTDWMGVPTKLDKNDKKPIKRPSGYDEYIKQGAKQGFQDDPTNPLRKKVKEQGVAEGFPKDPNAPKLVQDRKTGKWYDPNKEFEKKMTSPKVMAQMKRMAQKEGVAESVDYKSDAEALKKQGNMIGYHKTMVRYYDALANNASHRADVKRYESLANKHHAASKGVAEGDRPGMKDGRPYSDPLRRHPGNDSYMTPEYLIQKYQDELKKIAAGPYKRPKDVAMYKARIAKLQRQQGVAEVKKNNKNDDHEPFDYDEWKASTVKPRKPRGYKDAEALGKALDSEQSELRNRQQGVTEGLDMEEARERLDSLRRDLKAVTGNYPGDDRNRSILRRQILDLKEKIKASGGKKQGVTEEQEESCPHCGGAMFSEMIMNEKKDACYYKVKSRYKVWPSAYASGALVKCRKSGADSWGDGGKKNESSILEGIEQVDENLNKWFKEKWVRFGPDGKIRGDCARGDDSEGKPKCLPQSKAQNLGKEGRASAAARKRRKDPNPERSGKAINVNTKKK